MQILIIEDDESINKLYEYVLVGELGHECRYATSIAHLKALDFSLKVDVIILDYLLNDGDGNATLDVLKSKWERMPIILLITGWVYCDDLYRDYTLMKPFNLKELSGMLEGIEHKLLNS